MAFGVTSLGPNERLILIVCIAVIIRDVVLTVTIGVVKRLSEAFPEELDNPLVRHSILIKALKIQPAEVVCEYFDALEFLRALTLHQLPSSLSVPLSTQSDSRSLLKSSHSHSIESRIKQCPRSVAILEFRDIGIRAVLRGSDLIPPPDADTSHEARASGHSWGFPRLPWSISR
jgi:hypothetical protein